MSYKSTWLCKKVSKGIQTPCSFRHSCMIKQHVYFKAAARRDRLSLKDAWQQNLFSVSFFDDCLDSSRSNIFYPIQHPSYPRTPCDLTEQCAVFTGLSFIHDI